VDHRIDLTKCAISSPDYRLKARFSDQMYWETGSYAQKYLQYCVLSLSTHNRTSNSLLLPQRDYKSVGGIVTSLRAGRPRNRGSIPDRSERYISSPKRPDRLWGVTSFRWRPKQ